MTRVPCDNKGICSGGLCVLGLWLRCWCDVWIWCEFGDKGVTFNSFLDKLRWDEWEILLYALLCEILFLVICWSMWL